MKYIYVKIIHAFIYASFITGLLYLNQLYFAIGLAIFGVLTYPTRNDFMMNDDDKIKKNFANIDAVLKDHEKALTEIINRLQK